MDVDHGLAVPLSLMFGQPDAWPCRVAPLAVNVVPYPPPHRPSLVQAGPGDPEAQAAVPHLDHVREASSEGIEFVMWLIICGTLDPQVRAIHRFYHLPASNTAVGHLTRESASPRG